MLGTKLGPVEFLKRLGEECTRVDPASVKTLADLMWERYEAGRMIFVIGNGGSGSNASHFCEDIGKGTLDWPELWKRSRALGARHMVLEHDKPKDAVAFARNGFAYLCDFSL